MKATRLARTSHLEADFRTGSGPTLRYAPPKSVQEGRRARGDGPFWGAALWRSNREPLAGRVRGCSDRQHARRYADDLGLGPDPPCTTQPTYATRCLVATLILIVIVARFSS